MTSYAPESKSSLEGGRSLSPTGIRGVASDEQYLSP